MTNSGKFGKSLCELPQDDLEDIYYSFLYSGISLEEENSSVIWEILGDDLPNDLKNEIIIGMMDFDQSINLFLQEVKFLIKIQLERIENKSVQSLKLKNLSDKQIEKPYIYNEHSKTLTNKDNHNFMAGKLKLFQLIEHYIGIDYDTENLLDRFVQLESFKFTFVLEDGRKIDFDFTHGNNTLFHYINGLNWFFQTKYEGAIKIEYPD